MTMHRCYCGYLAHWLLRVWLIGSVRHERRRCLGCGEIYEIEDSAKSA